MPAWYGSYESQCWYVNTFLVNELKQIGRARGELKEWNNIYGSGCNFVCLAMMLEINPGYFASLLAVQRFFKPDIETPAWQLDGIERRRPASTFLVWDANRPYPEGQSIRLRTFWHPMRGRVACRLTLLKILTAGDLREATTLIAGARRSGLHVICGYDDHSHLVAGKSRSGYFLWDPVSDERHWHFKLSVEDNISGRYSLKRFLEIRKRQREFRHLKAQFWIYDVGWTPARKGQRSGTRRLRYSGFP